MRKLEGVVKEIVDEMAYLQRREARMRDTNGPPPARPPAILPLLLLPSPPPPFLFAPPCSPFTHTRSPSSRGLAPALALDV